MLNNYNIDGTVCTIIILFTFMHLEVMEQLVNCRDFFEALLDALSALELQGNLKCGSIDCAVF